MFLFLHPLGKLSLIGGRCVIHIGNLINRSQIRIGIAMAIETPRHAQRLFLLDFLHLGDVAVTAKATDTGIEVHRVIEIGVLRKHVNIDPLNRLAGRPTLAQRHELLALRQNQRMAVHTGLCRRNIGNGRFLYIIVTITAIHTQVTRMKLMTERNRLSRTVADVGVLRRAIVPKETNATRAQNEHCNEKNRREFIRPLWKYLRQKESSISYFFHNALGMLSHADYRFNYATFSTFAGVLARIIKNSERGVKEFSTESNPVDLSFNPKPSTPTFLPSYPNFYRLQSPCPPNLFLSNHHATNLSIIRAAQTANR